MKVLFFTVFFLNFLSSASQILQVIQEQETTLSQLSLARKEVLEKAVEKMSLKYIHEIIGVEKANKNKQVIRKIIKDSHLYIYSVKTSKPFKIKTGYKFKVFLSLSLDHLTKILVERGLFYNDKMYQKVLLLISLKEKKSSESFSWWRDEPSSHKSFLEKKMLVFHHKATETFKKEQYYLFSPIQSRMYYLLNEDFKGEISETRALQIGKYFYADIVIYGSLTIDQALHNQFSIDTSVVAQQVHGLKLAQIRDLQKINYGQMKDVLSQWFQNSSTHLFQKIIQQMRQGYKRGSFKFNELFLSLKGSYTFKQIYQFKKELEILGQIKSLKERKFTPKKIIFKVDSPLTPKKLSHLIKEKIFKSFHITFLYYNSQGVEVSLSFNK